MANGTEFHCKIPWYKMFGSIILFWKLFLFLVKYSWVKDKFRISSYLSFTHDYLTRNRNNFRNIVPQNKMIELNILYQGILQWNSVPFAIRTEETFNGFKSKFQLHLYESYV